MKKKYNVEITESAERDFRDLWNYIASDSITNAVNFINELESRIYTLEIYPMRYEVIKESGLLKSEYRHLVYGDYRIIYRIEGRCVYIMRVIHGSCILEDLL